MSYSCNIAGVYYCNVSGHITHENDCVTVGSETGPLLVDVGLKFERAEMQMIRWMCGISMKDRRTN